MDRKEAEMQFLGIGDVLLDSHRVIFSMKNLFANIILTLIVPLAFIILANAEVSDLLLDDIKRKESRLMSLQEGSATYTDLINVVTSELGYFLLIELVYIILVLILELLSRAAIVYSIACCYSSRVVTFKEVMRVVPKVWKRLAATFLCLFSLFFSLIMATVFTVITWLVVMGVNAVGIAGGCVLFVVYMALMFYLSIISQLAYMVSVLEDSQGFKAIEKGRNLLKGKLWLSVVVFTLWNVSLAVINSAFQALVVEGSSAYWRVAYGFFFFLLFSTIYLFGIVAQSIIYLVCKSYHNEKIDKSALSEHLQVYAYDYVPLTSSTAVQMGSYDVYV